LPNYKFVYLAILELLAFNAQNLSGHVTLATPLFEIFSGVITGLTLAKFEFRIFNRYGAISI